jgi:RecA-family ATPase
VNAADLTSHIEPVARALLGEPNRHQSRGNTLRYGTNGSMSVDLEKGTCFSFEEGKGGGVLDLVKRVKGLEGAAAVDWMRSDLGIDVGSTNGARPSQRKMVATYDYVGEADELLFQVVRFDPKDFRQRRPDGAGGWDWSVKGVRQVPYRLPDLQEAIAQDRTIVIAEGEKDVDALWKLNIPATTNAGGAGKWSPALSEFFRDVDVVLIPHNDPPTKNVDGTLRLNAYGKPIFPGQDHARAVARSLGTLPRSVRILELPDLPLKGDASDWISNGGTADEFWHLVETAAVAREAYRGPSADEELPSGNQASEDIVPFKTFDAGDWEGIAIERRAWVVTNRIPVGEPGIMSGDGGTGKTKLMLQLGVAVSTERPDWVGGVVETHGPVIIYSAEEKLKEMHRRVGDIVDYFGLSFSALRNRLHFICDEDDVVLATANDAKGTIVPTRSLLRLEKTVKAIRPALVIVENAADVYVGNESNRPLVTRFVRKLLGGLGQINGAAVPLIQHPSVSGLNDGTGRSGSTGWNNAGRWRLNFTSIKADGEDDDGLRQLHVIKSNYGPTGEKVRLRWERGVFVPERSTSSSEQAAAEVPIDETFLRCLDAVTAQGRRVSPHRSSAYAPAVFEKMPLAAGIKKAGLEKAMERLMADNRIRVDQGPRGTRQIVRAS